MKGAVMLVKVLLAGGEVAIPKIGIGLGAAFLTVWIDGTGFTSASNGIGSLGYILLETPSVDVGNIDDERRDSFTSLHARTVHWSIAPSFFVRDGGIARIRIAIPTQVAGVVFEEAIEFVASDCKGVSILTDPLDFHCEMLQEEKLAAVEDQALTDEIVAEAIQAAPQEDLRG